MHVKPSNSSYVKTYVTDTWTPQSRFNRSKQWRQCILNFVLFGHCRRRDRHTNRSWQCDPLTLARPWLSVWIGRRDRQTHHDSVTYLPTYASWQCLCASWLAVWLWKTWQITTLWQCPYPIASVTRRVTRSPWRSWQSHKYIVTVIYLPLYMTSLIGVHGLKDVTDAQTHRDSVYLPQCVPGSVGG